MSSLILCAIFLIPISVIVLCVIVALSKRPEFKRQRRSTDVLYKGPERRSINRD